jgi:hypothetical protein
MSEQTTTTRKSIFEGAKWMCAEMLEGKAHNVTIKLVEACEVTGDNGRKDKGFSVTFANTSKPPHAFTCMTTRRALATIMGTDDYTQWAGKRVCIYPVNVNVRGQTVQAIRYRAVAQTQEGTK